MINYPSSVLYGDLFCVGYRCRWPLQDERTVVCYKSTNTSMIVSGHPSRGPLVEVYGAFKLIEDASQLVPIILVPRTK